MIEQSQAMEILVESCPSFTSAWEAHTAKWGHDVLYAAAGDFAGHLLEIHRTGDRSQFARVVSALERLLLEGSPSVRDLATVGVLEGVQNFWANAGEDPEHFGIHLLPTSRRAWDSLNSFWSGDRK